MKPNQRKLKKYYFIELIVVVLTIYKHTVDVTLHDYQEKDKPLCIWITRLIIFSSEK